MQENQPLGPSPAPGPHWHGDIVAFVPYIAIAAAMLYLALKPARQRK